MTLLERVLQTVRDWLSEPLNRRKLEFFADVGSPELWLSWELAYAIDDRCPGCEVAREASAMGAGGRVDIVVKDAAETVWIELKVIWNNDNRGKVIASSLNDAIRGLNSGEPGVILIVAIGSHRGNADDVLTQLGTSLQESVRAVRKELDAGGTPMASRRDKRQIRVVGYEVGLGAGSPGVDLDSLAADAAEQRIPPGEFFAGEYVGCGQCGRFWRYSGKPPAPVCPDCGCGWRDRDGLRHCREVMFAYWLCGLADRLTDIPSPTPVRLGDRVLELLRRLRPDIREIGARHCFPPEVENW